MGTIASTNPALSSLLQTLTSASPEPSSALSSPAVESALQNAPASDLVQLSDEALQLQTAHLLFGTSAASDASNPLSTPDSLLSTLIPAAETPAADPSATSLNNPLAAYHSNLQLREMQAPFGVDAQSTQPSTLFNGLA
jgi:hypothetical protein